MLKLTDGQPYWLTLMPGLRVEVVPVSTAAFMAARQAARERLQAGGPDAEPESQVAFTTELALRGIRSWEGVGDAAGKPAAVTPDNIARLMADWSAYSAFDQQYAMPPLLQEAEKNVSSPSLPGSSAGAKPIAATVARTGPKAATTAGRAKPAPSRKTGRAATKRS